MDEDLVVKNGTIVTANEISRADVGIRGGKIVQIAEQISGGNREIDAKGKLVVPGGVEIHTHIDSFLHGMRTVDDWYIASLGAASGGTTTIVDFPMQGQGTTLQQTIDEYIERASGKSIVDFAFTPIISQFTEETYLEIPYLIRNGVPTFKIFMYYAWKVNDYDLAKSLDVIGKSGGIVSIHCENAGTIDYLIDKALKAGNTGVEWHAQTRPVSTECEAVSRVLQLAGELRVPVLIVHMSAGPAVVELGKARAKGIKAYGETMPHFLLLDEREYQKTGFEPMKYVITPPLRSADHQELLWAGLRTGTLSTIGSDHCAFPFKEKIRLFETRGAIFPMIPHGAPGIETRVPLLFSEGVSKGRLSLTKFVEIVAANPARLAGLYPQKGAIAIGSDADFVIIDPEKKVTLSQTMLHGNTDYTPFEGWTIQGYPYMTLSRGQILVKDGKFVGSPGHGEYLKRHEFEIF